MGGSNDWNESRRAAFRQDFFKEEGKRNTKNIKKTSKKTEKCLKPAGRVETFGIAGSSSGVGVTHFSILIANYLCGAANRSTAVLEWNSSGDFRRLEIICTGKPVPKQYVKTFKVLEVSYIKEAGRTELLECINHGFEAVVIDFGSDFRQIREEFLRCDKKILIGSFCEWKVEEFTRLISGKKREDGRWIFLTTSLNREMGDRIRSALKVPILQIPESADAFAITGEVMTFFREFLKY